MGATGRATRRGSEGVAACSRRPRRHPGGEGSLRSVLAVLRPDQPSAKERRRAVRAHLSQVVHIHAVQQGCALWRIVVHVGSLSQTLLQKTFGNEKEPTTALHDRRRSSGPRGGRPALAVEARHRSGRDGGGESSAAAQHALCAQLRMCTALTPPDPDPPLTPGPTSARTTVYTR